MIDQTYSASPQFLVLLLDISLRRSKTLDTAWLPGPLPLSYIDHDGKEVSTTGTARGTNMPANLQHQLYDKRLRKHCTLDGIKLNDIGLTFASVAAAEITILDVSETSFEGPHVPAIVTLHIRIDSTDPEDLATAIKTLSRTRGDSPSSARGAKLRDWLRTLPEPLGEPSATGQTFWLETPRYFYNDESSASYVSRVSVYPISLAKGISPNHFDGCHSEYQPVSPEPEVAAGFKNLSLLSMLPTGQSIQTDEHRSPRSVIRDFDRVISLSKDWSALIKISGTTFVLHARPNSDFPPQAEVYVRTIYADALLVGRLQSAAVELLENSIHETRRNSIADRRGNKLLDQVNSIDEARVILQSRYWVRVGDSAGQSSKLMMAYHSAADISDHFEVTERELNHFARIAERRVSIANAESERKTSTALNAIAYIGLPISIVFAAIELIPGDQNWAKFYGALIASTVFSAALILGMRRYTDRD